MTAGTAQTGSKGNTDKLCQPICALDPYAGGVVVRNETLRHIKAFLRPADIGENMFIVKAL